jgi:hypothetical protein
MDRASSIGRLLFVRLGGGSQEGRSIMQARILEPTPFSHRMAMKAGGALGLLALAMGIATISLGGAAAPPAPPSDKEPTIDGQPLYASWPQKGAQKPDVAIVFTGQTFGLLQPCGCSRPQMGGLERRMQFIMGLKQKGWPVAGIDLGDIYPEKTSLLDQGLLRYKTMMSALGKMGYIAVGVGKTEFAVELDRVLGEYALQGPKPPFLLAGNLLGVSGGKTIPLKARFQPAGLNRPMIDVAEVATVGQVKIGVAGIVGKSLADEVETKKWDPSVTFQKVGKMVNNAAAMKAAMQALQAGKAQINVLIYQGTDAEAAALAKAWPQLNAIICRSEESELPAMPQRVGNTLIIKVGEKGRYIGVLGAFQKNNGFDFHYQLVPLDEYYITPGNANAAAKSNPILPLLEEYAATVRDSNFLALAPRKPHRAQIELPKLNLKYVGSAACAGCHQAEFNLWDKNTKHGHALDTLEKVAKRPSLRNFDPECVVCHTVGFDYQTGYVDAKKTPNLKHVGCENCHGPGSGHVADPKAKNLLAQLSPWKIGAAGNLPANIIKQMAETPTVERGKIAVPPIQQRMINLTSAMCANCHNPDNDPHFDFYTYWPKVNHTGLAPKGGWPVKPPGK